jgi:hypothetical protein
MKKTMLKSLLLSCMLVSAASVFAQRTEQLPPKNSEPINRYELLDKTWYIVATKCPDKIGAESHYIHDYGTLELSASNVNNINYGTYVRYNRDLSDNPVEKGKYSLTTDDVGNLVLTLKKNKSDETSKYMVPMVETNHLTLIRTDGGDKCNIFYLIAP